jgi:hypothetical protein
VWRPAQPALRPAGIEREYLDAVVVEAQDADQGGADFDSRVVVEGHAEEVEEGGADQVAVGDEGDGFARVAVAELMQEGDDAELGFEHRFAVRDAGVAAVGVPESPAGVGVQLGESPAGPVAEVELGELLGGAEFRAGALGDGPGGFEGTLQGARADACDREIGEGVGKASGLATAVVVQVDAGLAAGEGTADGVGGGVADEEEGGQGRASEVGASEPWARSLGLGASEVRGRESAPFRLRSGGCVRRIARGGRAGR